LNELIVGSFDSDVDSMDLTAFEADFAKTVCHQQKGGLRVR
jgi:hypothetical protein